MAKGREKNRLRIRARCIMHEYTHQAAGGLRQLLLCQSAARVKLSFQLFERFFSMRDTSRRACCKRLFLKIAL